ncbi:MAG: sugar phosphate isomerase/epimerase [Ignavibacteria bacterium]|nr:sugar phosphate isomerase/epimerase [Ignavibacteria bacterium]
MRTLSLGIVTDEITPDFHEAVRYGNVWGISSYEIRCLTSGRIPAVDQSELNSVVRSVREHAIHITAVSPGIFKLPLSETVALEREITDVLPRSLDAAAHLGARLVIVFGFKKEEGEAADNYHRAVDLLRRAAEAAESRAIRIAVENEPGFWCDTGSQTARVIRDVGSSYLGANWDPCNGSGTDEKPYPDGYRAIRDHILNVHVKDTLKGALVECVPVGEGIIDWRGQLDALYHDEIVDRVTIETHCLPLVEKSRQNVETLKRMIDSISHQSRS